MEADKTVVIPETPISAEEVQELRLMVLEAAFMKVLIMGQTMGELPEDPTREETIAFATNHVTRIWDDYQLFKAEQNTGAAETALVTEEPSNA